MIEIEQGLSLADYWQILVKRKKIAILTLFLIIGATYVFTRLTTPVYRACAVIELKIESPNVWALGAFGRDFSWMIDIDTELQKIRSLPIMTRSAEVLGLIDGNTTKSNSDKIIDDIRGKIDVEEVRNTALIKIYANDANADSAVTVANAVSEGYVSTIVEERNERSSNTRQFIANQLDVVNSELRDTEEDARQYEASGKISNRIIDLGKKLAGLNFEKTTLMTKFGHKHPEIISINKQVGELESKLGRLNEDELKYIRLLRDVRVSEGLYEMLNRKLKEALIAEADKVIPAVIIDPARSAYLLKPNFKLNMMMSAVLGVLFAIIMVIVKENLDTSLSSASDMKRYLKVPTLGEIPHVKEKKSIADSPYLLIPNSTDSSYMEAYNTLWASINTLTGHENRQAFLFTSAMPKEGKSEILSNFGIVQSQNGLKTLLIDADFRQATLHRLFKTQRKPGIIDVLSSDLDWRVAIYKPVIKDEIKAEFNAANEEIPDLSNLSILPVGHLPPHPMRFVASEKFRELMAHFREEYDLILVDSPPMYYFADPAVLSSIVDGVIFVHRPGSVTRYELLRIKEQLSGEDQNFLGAVLNDVKGKRKGKYYYRYYTDKDKNVA
jgi:capsular exopolysaccharide synthesis family protein